MKSRYILFFAVFILCIGFASAIEQDLGNPSSNYNYIQVSTLKYEPYPVQSGRYVDVWLQIENTGSTTVKNVAFNLTPQYPFYFDGSDQPGRYFPELDAGQTALMHYKLMVDSNAPEGDNEIFYTVSTKELMMSSSVDLWIENTGADIAVTSVEANRISQGQTVPVDIQLQNIGNTPLTGVDVNLDFSNSAIPIVPINSTSEKRLSILGPGDNATMEFDLMALPDATAELYKIPISINFVDGTGTNYTKNDVIGLVVGSSPDLSITISDSGIYGSGSPGTITLKLTNKGLSNIKFTNVILQDTGNYSVLTDNTQYVGTIDSDDYQTADYTINVKHVKNGITPLVVNLQYLDANDQSYNETRVVDLKVLSKQQLGISSGSGLGTIIVVALILVGGYYLYRRWEKKKVKK